MTAGELMERLAQIPADTEVLAYDADGEGFFPVTGYVLNKPTAAQIADGIEGPYIELQTDLLL